MTAKIVIVRTDTVLSLLSEVCTRVVTLHIFTELAIFTIKCLILNCPFTCVPPFDAFSNSP